MIEVFFYGWWMIDWWLIFDLLMIEWWLRIDWLMHTRCNHNMVPCIHLQIYIANIVQFIEIIKKIKNKRFIDFWLIDVWLMIDYWLIDDWLMIDWWLIKVWLIDDWIMIYVCMIYDWLIN